MKNTPNTPNTPSPPKAAIIGGGVIGGGWVARFALMGWNVAIYDLDPDAVRKIGKVMDNARRSLPGVMNVALPKEGKVEFVDKIEKAVAGACWIQESVPESLDIKRTVFSAIQTACSRDAIVASSSSGFKPSVLQAGAEYPEQIMVAHPFNPVYLLPLVELVTTPQNSKELIERACDTLTDLAFYPLHITKEIDAHIADRLLEAVWREALWLINDDIASTQEIDDAIRYGFGVRWAQMGLFETYRIAGGEAGMRHFIKQFAPALKWPWTKLVNVPELTDALVDKIVLQSDIQAHGRCIRDMERARDTNLVAILRALKAQDWGSGTILNDWEKKTIEQKNADIDLSVSCEIETLARIVPLDWIDYNGHMNEARYLEAFSHATDQFMHLIGCDDAYIAQKGSYFTVETHIRHMDEAYAGQNIKIKTLCLDGQGKKMHLFHTLYEGERLLATGEHMLIHICLKSRHASEPGESVHQRLKMVAKAHAKIERPSGIGKAIGPKG